MKKFPFQEQLCKIWAQNCGPKLPENVYKDTFAKVCSSFSWDQVNNQQERLLKPL